MYLLFQYQGVYILSIMTKNYGIILEYDIWYYIFLQIEKQKNTNFDPVPKSNEKTVDSEPEAKIF